MLQHESQSLGQPIKLRSVNPLPGRELQKSGESEPQTVFASVVAEYADDTQNPEVKTHPNLLYSEIPEIENSEVHESTVGKNSATSVATTDNKLDPISPDIVPLGLDANSKLADREADQSITEPVPMKINRSAELITSKSYALVQAGASAKTSVSFSVQSALFSKMLVSLTDGERLSKEQFGANPESPKPSHTATAESIGPKLGLGVDFKEPTKQSIASLGLGKNSKPPLFMASDSRTLSGTDSSSKSSTLNATARLKTSQGADQTSSSLPASVSSKEAPFSGARNAPFRSLEQTNLQTLGQVMARHALDAPDHFKVAPLQQPLNSSGVSLMRTVSDHSLDQKFEIPADDRTTVANIKRSDRPPSAVFMPKVSSDLLAQLEKGVSPPIDPSDAIAAESGRAITGTESGRGHVANATVSNRSYAPQIAAQIANIAVQSGGGTTEIALNPEELGRIKITLTTTDAGLSVSILAERPETTDLMRKNINDLIREFQDIGHEALSFSFGNPSAGSDLDDQDHQTDQPSGSDPPVADRATSIHMQSASSGGLDLKL